MQTQAFEKLSSILSFHKTCLIPFNPQVIIDKLVSLAIYTISFSRKLSNCINYKIQTLTTTTVCDIIY